MGGVRLWDPGSSHQLANFIGHIGGVSAVAWSPDGTRLATAGDEGEVRLFRSSRFLWWRWRRSRTLTSHTRGVSAVTWSPDGTRLATASHDQEVRLWDAATGHHLTTLTGHTDWVSAVAWSPDGTRLATAGKGGDIRLWDLSRADHLAYLQADALACLQWAGFGIAVGGANGVIVLDLASLGRMARVR